MTITTLQDLQQHLASLASSNDGTIALDDAFLDVRVTTLIDSALNLASGSITLTGVNPSAIRLDTDQATLSVTGAQTPATDSATFLHLAGMEANVAFRLVGTEFNFILQVVPPPSWTLGDSLDELKLLTLPGWMNTESQSLYVSTYTTIQAVPAFDGVKAALPTAGPVAMGATEASLGEGLNYCAIVELTGVFNLAATLLGISDTLALWGTVDADIEQPTFDLRAPTGISNMSIGFVDVTGPWVGMKAIYPTPSAGGGNESPGEIEGDLSPDSLPEALAATDDGDPLPQIIYYIGSAVSVEARQSGTVSPPPLGFELDVIFQNPQSGQVVLQVVSTETEALSLGSLAQTLMETTGPDILDGAGPLRTVLDSITLEQFSALVDVASTGATVMRTRSVIGTSPPWPMPVAINGQRPKLDLTLDWQMMYPSRPPRIWSVRFAAVLTFTSALAFELDIMVSGNDLTVEGKEHGSITLSLAELLQAVAGIPSPSVNLSATFTNFTITVDVTNSTYVVAGTIGASFSLFGTQLLAVEDMLIGVSVDTSNSSLTVYNASLNGVIALGSITLQTSAVITNQANVDTVFSMHLVDETLGSMLNNLTHLVDPTYDISFPSPWNALLEISLDAFVIDVNVTKNIVTLTYSLAHVLDLGFISITGIGLQYTAATNSTPSSTVISLDGSFPWQSFGTGSSSPPLAWDALNENPPSIPGQGSSLFDLQYAALGQHIQVGDLSSLSDIQAVMAKMQAFVLPSPSGALPPFSKNGLTFSQESGWLIGAQFTVMSTVSIAAIFNDPTLYGIQISLAGQKAGIFAGLSFQILYRKISASLGVYHVELKLPAEMRTLQFGEVSLTLPVVIIDVYTNGDFKVNLGFPVGLNFSNSFSLQVFPFVGYGGFYFALLDGATSSRVPQITNGTFSPVIEFGVALSVGVGKTVDEGVLSGGLTVTVIGVLQGSLAWFNPTSVATPSDIFYWFQGTIAVTGRLYATINFAIIQASIDVTAYASVTLTIQSYSPIYIAISAGVSVSVKVKVLFITIHCSFSATVSASFTIGSSSPAPWLLAPNSSSNSVASVRRLRGQRTLHSARIPAAMRKVLRHEAARARLRGRTATATWPQVLVYPGPQTLTLFALASFTKSAAANTVNAVMLLTAQNSADPNARTLREQRVLHGDDPASTAFNILAEGMLRWGIWMQTGANGTVTADQLAELQATLQVDANAFDAAAVSGFFAANFNSITIDLAPASGGIGAAVFPMFPEISLATTDGVNVNFKTNNSVGRQYQANIPAYFQLLQTQYLARTGSAPTANGAAISTADDATVSMASIVYAQYFWMLTRGAVQAAIDYLASFPYTTPSAITLMQLATATDPTLVSDPSRVVEPNLDTASVFNSGVFLALPNVLHQVMLGDSFSSIAATLSGMNAYDFATTPQPLTANDIAAANLSAPNIFSPGIGVSVTGIVYTTNVGDTLSLIAARLLIRAAGSAVLATLPNLQPAVVALGVANPSIPSSTAFIDPGTSIVVAPSLSGVAAGPYIAVAGDTLTWIAACFTAVAQGIIAFPDFVTQLRGLNPSVAHTDANAVVPAGTVLNMPAVSRVIQAGDSMASLAITLLTSGDVIQSAMIGITTPNLLSPRAVLSTPLQYMLSSSDTFRGIAAKFSLTNDQLAQALGESSQVAVFAAGASLIIADVGSIATDTLATNLMNQAEWNNLSGYVSRFFLSGLRVPDPANSAFVSATPEQLTSTPAILSTFPTVPLYAATAQQFTIGMPPADGYQITLSNSGGASWLQFSGGSTLPITLTAHQLALMDTMAATPVAPVVTSLSRLALFQMVPPRTALQQHIAWQAAVLPSGSFTTRQATTDPSLWLFPNSLIDQLLHGCAQYELVAGTNSNPNRNITTGEVASYAWGTIVDVTITLPVTDGPSASVSNTYIVQGADDADADVLQALYTYLTGPGSSDSASIVLLYSPSPTSTNPSGLASDQLDATATFLLKTNLSTVTSSGQDNSGFVLLTDPTSVYDAPISNAPAFLALLWEASITRSGGFYLQYVNANGGAGLPASVFGNLSSATLSVLVLLQSQLDSNAAAVQTFNNCAVVGTNIDPSTTNVFVQPVTTLCDATTTLSSLATWYNASWAGTLQPADVARLNAGVALLLQPGAALTLPNNDAYVIQYGDTFQSISGGNSTTVSALVAAGSNATSTIFQVGAQVQFANQVLRPVCTVPPGTVGFELSREIPDLDTNPVDTLFNLVGWSVAEAQGFMGSGEGLPTTPSESDQDGSNGLVARQLDDTPADAWNYSQSMNVAPFAQAMNGSVSPALPSTQWNPYNGVGSATQVTLALKFQDIYGNETRVAPYDSIDVPVGYFDQIVSLGSWPSMAAAYMVTPGTTPAVNIDLSLTMQMARYIPSTSLPFASASAAIAADLKTYSTIYYQLAQPDVTMTLATSIAPDAGSLGISLAPFAMFVRSAYVVLDALSQLSAVLAAGASLTSLQSEYQVTATQLFTANASQNYAKLFGSTELSVPKTCTTVENDTLDAIASRFAGAPYDLTAAQLAANNAPVPLNSGADLAAPTRSATASAADSLSSIALAAQAAPAGVATANADQGILKGDITFTVGTQSYTTTNGDSFSNVAGQIGATVPAVAEANQYLNGIFVEQSALTITDVVVVPGDSLLTLAAQFASAGFTVANLAAANEALGNLFAPGTSLVIGTNPDVIAPEADDTLATFATKNGVGIGQLAAYNASASFLGSAQIAIPGLVTGMNSLPYSIYPAGPSDTLAQIAGKFSGATTNSIAFLNADLPGLLSSGQAIIDTASNKSVVTQDGDTLNSIIARFQNEQGVMLTLQQLVADVGSQTDLLLPQALWISPPMLGANSGDASANSLAGFAAKFNLDPVAVAVANAAAQGFLQSGISFTATFTIGKVTVDVPLQTGTNETFNSLASKVAAAGWTVTIADVATSASNVANLLDPSAVSVPLISPVSTSQVVTPSFTQSIFPISVTLTTSRDTSWIDPDFANVANVGSSSWSVPQQSLPDSKGNLTLDAFATNFQAAIPGVAVATGQADGIPGNAPVTIWGVNFASIEPSFGDAASVQFFALPPLSTSLLSGTFDIKPYVTGSGLGDAVPRNFAAVDLDVWLNTFLSAVDLVLSPGYVVPAYTLSSQTVEALVGRKADLALYVSQRVEYVLSGTSGGLIGHAQTALYQAMLNQLSNAVTTSLLVQVPVNVSSPFSGNLAPLLSGKITVGGASAQGANAYSFSTAKVNLANGPSTATFLFTVKSPASQQNITLDMQYDVVEMEVPTGPATIGDYQPSNWLQFILPQSPQAIGDVEIPIPLRAYPSPVDLVSQIARQAVAQPTSVGDLLLWDLDFVYQHQDAQQDSPTVQVTFGGGGASSSSMFSRAPSETRLWIGRDGSAASATVNVPAIFQNLAQFMAVWPALQTDLGKLPYLGPGASNNTAQVAIETFKTLVDQVAKAWYQPPEKSVAVTHGGAVYTWSLQKQGTSDSTPTLSTLTIIAPPNPAQLWPSVFVTWKDEEQQLAPVGTPTAHKSVYQYPSGIPFDAVLPQRFCFGGGALAEPRPTLLYRPLSTPSGLAAQAYQFDSINVIESTSGLAGVSITRNGSLIADISTNTHFIYQTPLSSFPDAAIPSIFAGNAIDIGAGPASGIGEALKAVFATLFANVPLGQTVKIRLACSYSYTLATATAGGGTGAVTTIPARLPVFLVPSYIFDPQTDEDPHSSTSFVAQVSTFINDWTRDHSPQTTNGAYAFSLTVFSPDANSLQPLIQATTLLYALFG